ncbi:LuxR C-terminal-related transcriptional regulator, partial [bacterium]|nr:LuxR C-terminal-related transcriptional regulator [bacterium]
AQAAQRALELWPEGDDEPGRLAALERLADCAQWSGSFADAVAARRTLAERIGAQGDPGRHARALRALADAQGLDGSWNAAIETRTEAARRFEEAGEDAEAALEHLAIGGRLSAQNRLDRALEESRRATVLAARAGRNEIVVRAKGAEGNLLAMQGDARAGRALAQEALSLALEENLRDAASEAYRRLASVLDYGSDFAGSRDAYSTAVAYCESAGDSATARICLGCMSFIVFRTGEWKRALEVCRQVMDDPASPPGSALIALGIEGVIRAKRGEMRGAKAKLEAARERARREQAATMELVILHGLALVAEFEDDDERAASLHAQVLDGWRQTQDRHDLVPVFLWQSTFFGRRGDAPEASERAAVLGSMAAGLGNPETDAARGHALAEVALLAGDAEEAARLFERALTAAEKLEIPLEVALTSWRTGVALARCGKREAAVDRLVAAYRTTRKLGARPIAARISADLLALGERVEEGSLPDEELRSGRVGLTRRQMEIVRLVAEGLTNKEIAGKLYVSTRTVDMHVSNALD